MITLFHMSIGNCFRMNYTESYFAESERMRQGKSRKKGIKSKIRLKKFFYITSLTLFGKYNLR